MFHKLNLPMHMFIFPIVLENIQTTALQELLTRQLFEKQSHSEHSPFLYKADSITPVDETESRISSMVTESSGKYIRHVLYLYKKLTMLVTCISTRHN
jgi:hypothetical protein